MPRTKAETRKLNSFKRRANKIRAEASKLGGKVRKLTQDVGKELTKQMNKS